MHAPSEHCRLPRRRNGCVLPRRRRCSVGQPVADPQPNDRVAEPQPNAITDFADHLSFAPPDSNPESRSDPHTEQQASTEGQPNSKPLAQSRAGTHTDSNTGPGSARDALAGLGVREEAAPRHRRHLGADDYAGSGPGSCSAGG